MLIARASDQVSDAQLESSALGGADGLLQQNDQWHDIEVDGRRYRIRQLDWQDMERHRDYQRLRADVFVGQLGWKVPLDDDGCERDRYDIGGGRQIVVYTVEGIEPDGTTHLLGGIRIFRLRSWDDSMLMHEFREADMVPPDTIRQLVDRFSGNELLELTRFCVRAGRWFPREASGQSAFDLAVARDLCYAAVYRERERHAFQYALALVDTVYGRVMRRAHFAFETLYQRVTQARQGYQVALIDLPATIRAIRASGDVVRGDRMVSLSEEKFLGLTTM